MLLLAVVLLLFQGVLTNVGISDTVLELCYSEVESCVYNNSTDNSCNNTQELSLAVSSNRCLTRSFTLSLTQELLLNVTTATVKVTLDGDKNNISNCENEDMCEALDSYIEMVLAETNEVCNAIHLSKDKVSFSCAVPEFSSDGAYIRLYVLSNPPNVLCGGILNDIPNAALVLVQDSEYEPELFRDDLDCCKSFMNFTTCGAICSGGYGTELTDFCEPVRNVTCGDCNIGDEFGANSCFHQLCCSDSRFDTDCDMNQTECEEICKLPASNFSTECQEEFMEFCVDFVDVLLGEEFVAENVQLAVDIVLDLVDQFFVSSSLGLLEDLTTYFTNFTDDAVIYLGDEDNAEDLLEIIESLLDEDKLVLLESEETPLLLENIGNILEQLGMAHNDSFQFSGINIVLLVQGVSSPDATIANHTYQFPRPNIVNFSKPELVDLFIPLETLCGEDTAVENCSAVVATAIVRNLADFLDSKTFERREVGTSILSTVVLNAKNFSEAVKESPATLSFAYDRESSINVFECVFWNYTLGYFDNDGISTIPPEDDDSRVTCIVTHITDFAVLVDVSGSGGESVALTIVSYIGCSVSIVCLIITLILLVVFKKLLNKGVLLYVHFNLALALLLALLVFVAGIESATEVEWLCTVVAALLHYLFLCVFCWMLAEGIMLYLLVVRVFGTAADKWYYLIPLGWGLPLPIAAISAGILHDDYGSDDYCWIDADPSEPAIWLFVGPMLIIIMINTVILLMTVFSMVKGRKHGGAEQNVKTVHLVKTALKGTVILLPLLGLTWVLGIFAVNENTAVFAWLFTIINSLQGVAILVLHVLRNEHLLKAMKKYLQQCTAKVGMKIKAQEMSESEKYTKESSMGRTSSNSSGTELVSLKT